MASQAEAPTDSYKHVPEALKKLLGDIKNITNLRRNDDLALFGPVEICAVGDYALTHYCPEYIEKFKKLESQVHSPIYFSHEM